MNIRYRKKKRRYGLFAAAGLLSAFLTVAAVNAVAPDDATKAAGTAVHGHQPLRETFEREFNLPPSMALNIRNAYGHVTVSGWDGDTVLVSVHKRLDPLERGFHWFKSRAGTLANPTGDILEFFNAVDIEIDREDGTLHLSATCPSFMAPDLSLSLHMIVKVPRATDLSIHTDNGSVIVQNVDGVLHASSINGKIAYENIRGQVNARTRNGEIFFRAIQGGIIARAANGSIRVDGTELGHVYPISCATDNGGITLRVPTASSFELAARTSNGFVRTALKVGDTVPQGAVRTVNGPVGRGGPSIELQTLNGSIYIDTL